MQAARLHIEALLRARRLDRTVTDAGTPPEPVRAVPTGLPWLDPRLAGGWPCGETSEIVGPVSSGRTSLLLASLAAATARGDVAALIDTHDTFDASSALAAGVALDHLLWARGDPAGAPRPACPARARRQGVRAGARSRRLRRRRPRSGRRRSGRPGAPAVHHVAPAAAVRGRPRHGRPGAGAGAGGPQRARRHAGADGVGVHGGVGGGEPARPPADRARAHARTSGPRADCRGDVRRARGRLDGLVHRPVRGQRPARGRRRVVDRGARRRGARARRRGSRSPGPASS